MKKQLRTVGCGVLLLIIGLAVSCNDKKEKVVYNEVSVPVSFEAIPFEIEIFNSDSVTVQRIKFEKIQVGDFYKIEDKISKRGVSDLELVASKSHLVKSEKLGQIQQLIQEQLERAELIEIPTINPIALKISMNFSTGMKREDLDEKAALTFIANFFELLEGQGLRPNPIVIPTH